MKIDTIDEGVAVIDRFLDAIEKIERSEWLLNHETTKAYLENVIEDFEETEKVDLEAQLKMFDTFLEQFEGEELQEFFEEGRASILALRTWLVEARLTYDARR